MTPPRPPLPKVPISVCLIAKNEAKNLPPLARSLRPLLTHPQDEVILVDTGSQDATMAVARKQGWRVIPRPDLCSLDMEKLADQWLTGTNWRELSPHAHFKGGLLRSFAEARQISFDAAKNEVCFWLDADDVLTNCQDLRNYIDAVFVPGRQGAIMLAYDYAHDEAGNCTTVLWRERIVTKSDFHWVGRCHETLLPRDKKQLTVARTLDYPGRIRHAAPKGHQFSDLRNYILLRYDWETGSYADPRTQYYLGNSCRGLGRHEEAIRWYLDFVGRSGSRDDVMAAFLGIAHSFMAQDKAYRAIEACLEASRVNPTDPRTYYYMAECWYTLGNYENVLTYLRIGDQFQMQDTLHAFDPNTLQFYPAILGARAARELGRPDIAMQYAQRALQERPNLPMIQKGYKDMEDWANAEMQGQTLMQAFQACTDPHKAAAFFRFSPHLLARGIGTPDAVLPGNPAGKKTVTFFCGTSTEPWGPESLKTGIGASEKMVYDVARRLAAQGVHVCVYATLNCDEGEYEGVNWRFSGHFNPRVHTDILIVWRMPQIVDKMPFNADKIYVWMHDVGDNNAWTPPILALTDKVLFLSEFQRKLHPAVPDEKVFLTRNGIDLSRQLYLGAPKEKKIIYCSSPDRGWLSTIDLFNNSELAEDGWKLYLFYGFGKTWRDSTAKYAFSHIADIGMETNRYRYEAECRDACDGVTIINRGRVGWEEMAKEFQTASAWLYPTKFDEISCVAAMEAMAAGCRVYATDHAALAETLKDYPAWTNLSAISPKDWHAKLAECTVPTEAEAYAWAITAERFDVTALVDKWIAELL